MEFKANSGVWGTMFGIPCIVADNFLKLATGEQIKVLIYVLRFAGKSVTSEEIALNTGITIQQAEDAVLFWQQANVLSSDSVSIPSGIMQLQQPVQKSQAVQSYTEENNVSAPVRNQSAPEHSLITENKRPNYRPSEIAQMMQNDAEFKDICRAAEFTFGSINNVMHNALILMHSYFGMKAEVIMTLLNYCKQIEKTNPAYIEKIAYNWYENGIDNLEAAQEEVGRMLSTHDYTRQIMRAFEMNRNPTTKQKAFVDEWRKMGFGIDVLKYAYEITIEKIDKLSFEYINKILINWQSSGLKKLDEIKKAETDFKKNKKSTGNPYNDDFDVEQYKFVINNI